MPYMETSETILISTYVVKRNIKPLTAHSNNLRILKMFAHVIQYKGATVFYINCRQLMYFHEYFLVHRLDKTQNETKEKLTLKISD